jgi:hypothetical protein
MPFANNPQNQTGDAMPQTGTGDGDRMRALVAVLHRMGGRVSEHELRYQIVKHQLQVPNPLEDLIELEEQGLIRSSLEFELTDMGRQQARDREPDTATV